MSEGFDRTRSPGLEEAERLRTRVLDAGRWFGRYLVAVGVVSAAWIVLIETVFAEGFARNLVVGAWALLVVLAQWWAERHQVYPAGATRALGIATAVWFLSYLLLVGPLVRWQFDAALLPWTLAAALMSLPFFVAAAWILRRR